MPLLDNCPDQAISLGQSEIVMSTTINLAEAKAVVGARWIGRRQARRSSWPRPAGRPAHYGAAQSGAAPARHRRALEIDDEALLAPTDPEDLDWANGKYTDEFGISLPRKS